MRCYDGLICFGGSDWWYHNRGHYDMQMCRQFARHVPVLYVNSIGVRTPSFSEGAMFFRRVGRKVKSWGRGFVRIDSRFGVVSPFSVPGTWGRKVTSCVLPALVRRSAKRMGIAKPLVWIECPTAAEVVEALNPVAVIYQRTDRYEEFPGADPKVITKYDQHLKARADMTLFCSSFLFEEESEDCQSAHFVDHGVDFERFRDAGSELEAAPDDIREIPRPRVGFVGSIDSHTFDARLFVRVVRRLPDVNFVLVGSCSLSQRLYDEPNVYLLGQKPYDSVAAYMAACDVLIMPWNRNEWIKACNPVKLKEYLAVGRPVVSTPFEELRRYREHIRVAAGADAFAAEVRGALEDPGESTARQERVRGETWSAKAQTVLDELVRIGITVGHAPRSALISC